MTKPVTTPPSQTMKPKLKNGQIPCECGERTINECADMPDRHCGLNNGIPRRSMTNPTPQSETTQTTTEADIKRIKLKPCPFCKKEPSVGPKDWRVEGNCVGYVECVNPKCIAQPRVDENLDVCDERGSAGYKLVAINLWNKALS